DNQTKAEASNSNVPKPRNIMWNGAFDEPLSVEDSKANDESANAEVVLGPVFRPDNEIEAESIPKAVSLSPAQIEAASPPISEFEDIRKIGIARHAEEERNKFVENLKSEIVDRGGNTTEISEGVEQITFNRTMLPLYPQDNYWGKSINAAEMARMFNESMSKLGNLLPGYLYGLITDGIIDFNRPGFISASYRNKDGSVHTLIGAGACWGGTAMIQTMEHVNRQLIELGIPPMFLFVDKVSGETYPLNIPYKTNFPHPDGYMTYRDELTGYNQGYTFSQDDNSVLNVDIRFLYNPEFVEYMQSKGFDVEMNIELGFAFADEKYEGVGYPMIVESDTAFGEVTITLTGLGYKN
ncbi:hypothetical protein KC660_03225, partial [Candidatus Dojkabacteria bacterium]|nr:hypothetical protein [Candidatus Dojkabacteria bacterium]